MTCMVMFGSGAGIDIFSVIKIRQEMEAQIPLAIK